ncbi:coiled-coil domain-containing protein 40, partial [Copidosoma floridanum]|uniref:coiled-coil domain-containing protein 40 n=1 Tax=Copidosoma floridanum TaxID=29053 RepID=UPI0006C9A536
MRGEDYDDDNDDFKILDPDDPLMNRFQEALKSHLKRIDEKLSEEIYELGIEIKDAEKKREDEAVRLYELQKETSRQESAVDNYKDMLAELVNLRADMECRLQSAKEAHRVTSERLKAKKLVEKQLGQTIESIEALQQQFSKWEDELRNNLTISQRISEKDDALERELVQRKQQRDYVLFKLEDEVWRLQAEIKDMDDQLQIKDAEKASLRQTIADVSADLDGLKKEHKTLYNAWNVVLHLINKQDQIHEEAMLEHRKTRETLERLETQITRIKKDSDKEMENNERLTSLQSRISEEILSIKKSNESDRDKYFNLEMNFVKVSKLLEQSDKELGAALLNYESTIEEEKYLRKESMKFQNERRALEDDIFAKLDDKITHDKVIRHLNKLLHEAKDINLENELNLTRFENSYGKSLLELEKFNSILENGKFDLDVVTRKNTEKQEEIDTLQAESKNFESLFKQKERKIASLSKKIEEMLELFSGKEANPIDAKIDAMEKNIGDTDKKIKEGQKFWLREQGNIFSLSKQRDSQLQELGIIAREIILMEQKNLKLEIELEQQKKEEAAIEKTMNTLQQKLIQINMRLASQKQFKNKLEDQNSTVKNEYIKSLEDAELELIKFEADIRNLNNDKFILKETLLFAQQESLSWEKKVQLANETNKSYKEERNAGGDIAMMKSEIHKMEMRLSYLRKAQEKLIQDMEFCVSRRDNIIDEAVAREKKNPKNQHNQRMVLRKRLDDQKTKIKQLLKEIKQIEKKTEIASDEQNKLLEYLTEGQKLLRQNEDVIPDIEKQIAEAELIKHHNLEILVRKQRKVNMLRDLKNGHYKSLIKNEAILSEESQNQQNINKQLNEIMQRTEHDFPLLKNQIRKILLT